MGAPFPEHLQHRPATPTPPKKFIFSESRICGSDQGLLCYWLLTVSEKRGRNSAIVQYKRVNSIKINPLQVPWKGKLATETKEFFVPGCKFLFFCCKVGCFLMSVCVAPQVDIRGTALFGTFIFHPGRLPIVWHRDRLVFGWRCCGNGAFTASPLTQI